MSGFTGSEGIWASRLASLRNVVRQHVIADQLATHLDGIVTALDVGCGQGTQAIRLAERGITVTGVDPSPELLDRLRTDAASQGVSVETIEGEVGSLPEITEGRCFDLVCAHGLLMYLPDALAGLQRIAHRVAPGGLISFTVRNGDALAFRPGIRGDYGAALAAMDSSGYRNELGVDAAAHTLSQVQGWCDQLGLAVDAWYGVRVFTDGLPVDTQVGAVDLPVCLAAEVQAGRRDPYRRLGSMLHSVCQA